MGPGHYRKATPSDGYYEEVWEVVIMPEGSRSQSGTLTGVGPGLCGLPRILIPRTTVNKGMKRRRVRGFDSTTRERLLHLR
jgi:hypothetical protein